MGREVAIKVLAERFSDRFEREVRWSSLVSAWAFAEVFRASDACVGWSRPDKPQDWLPDGGVPRRTTLAGQFQMLAGSEPHGTFEAN
jgi:hypothetical protein